MDFLGLAMTLTQLRYIVAIADAGLNITLAAELVHATQPGLSKQLKQIEGELGFQIFSRRGRSLDAISPAGAQVIERARVMLDEARNIRALAANLRGEVQGELSLATTHTQARFVLPPAIARLKHDYPDLNIHIRPHGEPRVLSLIESGEVDLAIVSTSGSRPQGDIAVPLFRWQRAVVVPFEHELARLNRPVDLATLAEWPLVSYESSLRDESSLQRAFAAQGLQPRIACTSGEADLIKTYVQAGMGVGVLAEIGLNPQDGKELKVLNADGLFPECITWLVLQRDRVLRDYAARLVNLIAPQIGVADLQRALAGHEAEIWPEPPRWSQRAPWLHSATQAA